jgi:apolipoprotein N-acyltransferase
MVDTPNVPLVVDLDGTLIRTDLMWESLARCLRRNPFSIFQILCWWAGGRARLKQRLAARVQIDPTGLPYHERFLAWLRQEKISGRTLVLATASDLRMAQPVAEHLGLFTEVLASDGQTNLRQENKRLALVRKYGERGFDYAGNSPDDLVVWRSARQAIVVNAPARLQRLAAACAQPGPSFCDGHKPLAVGRRFGAELLWRSGYLFAAAAGLLLALAFPKFSIAGFAWVVPALLLAAAHGQSPGDAFRAGCVGGLTFWLVSLYWLLLMPAPGFPILAWVALAGYVALYFGAWVLLAQPAPPAGTAGAAGVSSDTPASKSVYDPSWNTWAGRTVWAMGGAAAWVALEMVRARLLGGFPWSFLGVSQYQLTPLLQLAACTGVYGVSFLVAWFSLALYAAGFMILRQPAKRQVWQAEILLPMAVVLICYVGGFLTLNRERTADNHLRVTAIQPSVPQTLIWNSNNNGRRFRELLELSQRALNAASNTTDLLVWPESAVPDLGETNYETINRFVRSNHVWLVLNGEDMEGQGATARYFNAAFLVDPDGRWRQVYHKRRLVIFGEYVPLANWLPLLKWLTPISGGWTPGEHPVTFDLERRETRSAAGVIQVTSDPATPEAAGVRCAPLICFEDAFPGAVRDSARPEVDFLINLSNDGWFQESAEQWQQLANAVFRAVENGMPLLRCANNGVTCLINRHGRLESTFRDAHDSEYGSGALTVDIPLPPANQEMAPTFYNRHGDWFGWLCVAATVVRLVRVLRREISPRASR